MKDNVYKFVLEITVNPNSEIMCSVTLDLQVPVWRLVIHIYLKVDRWSLFLRLIAGPFSYLLDLWLFILPKHK